MIHLSAILIQRNWRCYHHRLLQQRKYLAAFKLQVNILCIFSPSNVFPKLMCLFIIIVVVYHEDLVQDDCGEAALQEVAVISEHSSTTLP